MKSETRKSLNNIEESLRLINKILEPEKLKKRLNEINKYLENPRLYETNR